MGKDGLGVSGQDAVLPLWIRFHLNREMRSAAERNKNQWGEQKAFTSENSFILIIGPC